MLAVRLGLRNLARHRWRSGLTLAGIGLSVGLMIWSLAFIDGWLGQMVRAATAVDAGQLQVQTAGWAETPRAYHAFETSPALLASVAGVEGVVAVSPRVELYGIVGHEQRSQVGRVVGVDPVREAAATPVAEAVVEGRWLSDDPAPEGAPREVVLGEAVARQLRVGPGDELVVFAEAADGSLGNDLLGVVGVVRTANFAVDQQTAFLHIDDARFLAALEGRANALLVRTEDLDRAVETADAVAAALGAARDPSAVEEDALVVRAWPELLPGIFQIISVSRSSYGSMYLFIYLVAAVGILNTQRMSALERRREFGVLIAVGMRPRRLFRILLAEALVLGAAGALLGVLLGGGVGWYHATAGFNLELFTDEASFSYMGVTFSERLYAELDLRTLLEPVLIMLGVAVVSGLWPAWTAARLRPAPTIAGRTA